MLQLIFVIEKQRLLQLFTPNESMIYFHNIKEKLVQTNKFRLIFDILIMVSSKYTFHENDKTLNGFKK